MFGKAALSGNRDKFFAYAGYNKNGLSYVNENTFGVPLVFGAGVFTNLPEGLSKKSGVKVEGNQKTGWYVTPDFKLGIDTGVSGIFGKKKTDGVITDIYVSPYIFKTLYSEKTFATAELRFFNSYGDVTEICGSCKSFNSLEGALTADFSPVQKLTLAGMICGGIVCYSDEEKISLEKNAVTVSDGLGLSNRGVRAGYSRDELKSDSYGLCSMEVRFNVLSMKIPPAFPCNFVPYVFTDFAVSYNRDSENMDFLDAYGIGIQVDFECPVFAYFNFSYGINHEGKGKFIFAAMQSF